MSDEMQTQARICPICHDDHWGDCTKEAMAERRIAELEAENELLGIRLKWLIKAAEPLAMEEVQHPPFNGQMRTTWNVVTKLRAALYLAKNPKANWRGGESDG